MAATPNQSQRSSRGAPRQAGPATWVVGVRQGQGQGAGQDESLLFVDIEQQVVQQLQALAWRRAPRVTVPAGHRVITVLGMDPGKHTGLAWMDGHLQALEEIAPARILQTLRAGRPLVIFEDKARKTWTGQGSAAARARWRATWARSTHGAC